MKCRVRFSLLFLLLLDSFSTILSRINIRKINSFLDPPLPSSLPFSFQGSPIFHFSPARPFIFPYYFSINPSPPLHSLLLLNPLFHYTYFIYSFFSSFASSLSHFSFSDKKLNNIKNNKLYF